MIGNNNSDGMLNVQQNSIDRFNLRSNRPHDNVYQFNEQLQCLMQQVNLYRELLAQVTYQNTLLGGRSFAQNINSQNGQSQTMNYPPEILHNMLSSMGSMGPLGAHGLSNLGLNMTNIGGNSGLNQSMNSQGLGVQGYQGQVGMGMAPNLQNLQTFQILQSLGMMSQGGMGPLHNNTQQTPNSAGIQELLRSQLESQNRLSDQDKRNKDDSK